MRDWISFWDSDHSIYVNARHFDVHYRTIADMIVRHVPSPDAVVLDFGCGDVEELLAARQAYRAYDARIGQWFGGKYTK